MQGKLLHVLARAHGARRVLEIGTLGGYSTVWLAGALPPDGRLITLEVEAHYAEIARANIERAGLAGVVEIRVGPARETLPQLAGERLDPFDLIFIDADKRSNAEYLHLLRRSGNQIYRLAQNIYPGQEGSEWAGACFSPDGQTLFANLQGAGVVFAIWTDRWGTIV